MSDYVVRGYTPTIGIECHVQLKTATKLFAPVGNDAREAPPNSLVSHICFGMPGALPVLNKAAIELAIKAAKALHTTAQPYSKFDRKHYFYPDLPKGYQISQFDEPIIIGGHVTIVIDGEKKDIAITRAHLEEDAGKSTHPAGADYSLVDLNRAGTPLLEIVSEPVLHSPAEAKAYARELYLAMKFAGVSDANLYYGNMRFDVNVSVSKDATLGTRSETKNLNSFRSVERAVEFEIQRQIDLLEAGDTVVQETRGWQDDKQITFSQRTKEDAHDYRYFPDPDLPPIVLTQEYVNQVEASLRPLPDDWRTILARHGVDQQTIEAVLDGEVEFEGTENLWMFEQITDSSFAKKVAVWLSNIVIPMRRTCDGFVLSKNDTLQALHAVYDLSLDNKLSSNSVKELIERLLMESELPASVERYAEENGLIQVSDSAEIEAIVVSVLAENSKAAEDVKAGEMKAIGFLVGQVMKQSKGKANPQMAQEYIKKQLGLM